MPDIVNRKACDRCHEQKLGCKRLSDGTCERCLRQNIECKSSPSLRDAKKQHQERQQPPTHDSQSRQPRQQQQERTSPPQTNYTERQGVIPQHPPLRTQNQQHHAIVEPLQQGAERRLPKRRRTGSDNHLVRRDVDLGPHVHLIAGSHPIAGLGDFVANMGNMDYMALSEASMTPNHLLPAQLPPGIDEYFSLHQVVPDLWDNSQAHEEPHHLHHTHPAPQYHEQNQHIFPQTTAPPSAVPDSVTAYQSVLSSTHHNNHHYRGTPVLSGRRRAAVSGPSHVAAPVQVRRRSRSNHIKFDLQVTTPSASAQDSQTDLYIMDQFFPVYSRVQVLSTSLMLLERGESHSAGANGTSDAFTVAELYRHTHTVADILERVANARNAPNGGAGAQLAGSPLDPADPANSMFTLSLYVRLLNMFQRLFRLVRSLLAKADPRRDEIFPPGLLPEMNIGAASIGAHPAFHMSMTVQLAMQFLNRLREATTSLGLAKSGNGNGTGTNGSGASDGSASSFTDVVNVSFSAIRSQEDTLSQSLRELKGELDDYMDAMDAIDAGVGEAEKT